MMRYRADVARSGDDPAFFPTVFTAGRFTEEAGRVTLPLAVQANHAACDGWHVAEFFRVLDEELAFTAAPR